MDIDEMIGRIKSMNAYAYAELRKISLKDFFIVKKFNREMENCGKIMREEDYLEAVFICNPDEVGKMLGMTEEEKEMILKNSKWKISNKD